MFRKKWQPQKIVGQSGQLEKSAGDGRKNDINTSLHMVGKKVNTYAHIAEEIGPPMLPLKLLQSCECNQSERQK
jgi:hypothetical protein